jgi:hypothetical protein
MWKEAVVASFEVLLWHLPYGLRKATKNLSQDSPSLGSDLNPGPPEYKAEVLCALCHENVKVASNLAFL